MAGALLASVPATIAYNFLLDRFIAGCAAKSIAVATEKRFCDRPAQRGLGLPGVDSDASDSKPYTEHSRPIWPTRQPLAFAPSSSDREGPA
jgi:hypothetical protein